MKSAILLVGGKGSRFSNISDPPKHLSKIKGKFILIHLFNLLKKNGFNKIIIPLGYKKDYFIKFFDSKKNQKKFNFTTSDNDTSKKKILIKYFNAGLSTSKLNRIKRSLKYIKENYFLTTYGDGISDINIKKILRLYKKENERKNFISTYFKNSQYGHIKSKRDKVVQFNEKPLNLDPINIGFFIFNKKIFLKYYNTKFELEDKFLKRLINNNLLKSYLHKGYFFSIDDKKDIIKVEQKLSK